MNKKRLLKLADFLETVPRRAFDMARWEASPAEKPETGKPGDCGFAGCAMGWAVHAKLFRGLHFAPHRWNDETKVIAYRGYAEFEAASLLFDIAEYQARCLFAPSYYTGAGAITPKRVARKIRAFAETGEADDR